MTGTRIVFLMLDTHQLILYKEDGEQIRIPQGDPRIRPILDVAVPILKAGGIATIEIDPVVPNEYKAFEKKTNGFIKLFRVAKSKVAHLFGSDEPLEPITVGQPPAEQATTESLAPAIEEIMANATPVSSDSFKESETTEEQTMVAVIGTGADTRIVPGVEALKDQFAHSNKLGSTKGVENLIARLGAIINNRGHSVQDVLRFVERGDLPAADDGCIVAYKVLTKTPKSGAKFEARDGRFFDCHSGNVPQELGSYVCMDEKLVDLNRRQECSVGLHIARRNYLRWFGGDVCTIVKIAPEDVITVPVNEPDKVRVRGYHILGVLPQEDWSNLRQGKPLTSEKAQQLLAQIISGKHVGKFERVEISGPMGGDVTVTSLGEKPDLKPAPASAPKAVALDDERVKSEAPINPKEVSRKADEQKVAAPVLTQAEVADKAIGPMSPRMKAATDLVEQMLDDSLTYAKRREAAVALVGLKKRSKVSYSALGLISEQIFALEDVLAGKGKDILLKEAVLIAKASPTPKKTPAVKAKPEQLVATKKSAKAETKKPVLTTKVVNTKGKTSLVPQKTAATASAPKAPGLVSTDGPRQQVAKQLYGRVTDTIYTLDQRQLWAIDLQDHKKKSKISWIALGLPEDTGKVIDNLLKNTN